MWFRDQRPLASWPSFLPGSGHRAERHVGMAKLCRKASKGHDPVTLT